ncbi:MAG TPA: HNH endonuclease signature motif containing protein [Pseudolabrys sp.]|nr:HNH endonuclease signature motif containing protein [Pseudolabrys sp.]
MEHFLGYHNAVDGGPYFRDEKSKHAEIENFFTAKPFRPDTLIGNKLWVIEGRDTPRQYRIVSTGTITAAVWEKRPEIYRTSEQEDGLSIEFSVNESNDPIEVTNLSWFRKLKDSYQNFSIGFTRITDPEIVKEIESAWESRGTIDSSNAMADVQNILTDAETGITTKKRLIDARLGQGRFRDQLEIRWGNACAITGCKIPAALRASHIKAWRHSNNDERLDPNNGLLLAAHVDALFDTGLVTFLDNGKMLLSKQITANDQMILRLSGSLSKLLTLGEKNFLRHHRQFVFQDNKKADT